MFTSSFPLYQGGDESAYRPHLEHAHDTIDNITAMTEACLSDDFEAESFEVDALMEAMAFLSEDLMAGLALIEANNAPSVTLQKTPFAVKWRAFEMRQNLSMLCCLLAESDSSNYKSYCDNFLDLLGRIKTALEHMDKSLMYEESCRTRLAA